jgi:hypothetical protein
MIELVGWAVGSIGTAYAIVQGGISVKERRFLKATLAGLIGDGCFRSRDDLVRLKRYLSTRIRYDVRRVNDRRPLLRHSAEHILRTGFGFCGENARVAIRLLGMGGVRAHRLYLEGPRWQHNVVEHEWEGSWMLFDAHPDPALLLADEDVGRIGSSDISRFPNHDGGEAWVRSYRIKLAHGLGILQRFENSRPPEWVTTLAETPSLMRAGLGLLCAVFGLLIVWMG